MPNVGWAGQRPQSITTDVPGACAEGAPNDEAKGPPHHTQTPGRSQPRAANPAHPDPALRRTAVQDRLRHEPRACQILGGRMGLNPQRVRYPSEMRRPTGHLGVLWPSYPGPD